MLIGHLRYNTFLVLYPLGVTGELVCFCNVWTKIKDVKPENKPFSIFMPNNINIIFDYAFFIKWLIPIIYIVFFPQLFMHMWI
jgi:very-long-chain (3R)-3-hydroxyacyl-CoA dehydratase